MPLINCETNLILTCSPNCNRATTFAITDTKLHVPVATLSTQPNTKFPEQLKSGFTCTINWNKYQSKISTERSNEYLGYLIDSRFQGVNRLFENNAYRIRHTEYFFPNVETKDYDVMIGGKTFLLSQLKII